MTHTLPAPKPLTDLSHARGPSMNTWPERWSGKVASSL